MRVVKIPKKSGGHRTIYVPDPAEMGRLRAMLPRLNELQERADTVDCQHGFRRGRSPLTNALPHRGFRFTLCFDLADFFDSVTRKGLCIENDNDLASGIIQTPFAFEVMDICFQDGCARQGLPTSPLIANIAASGMDRDIVALKSGRAGRFDRDFVYTRYADDLTFSFDSPSTAVWLKAEVPAIVEKHGFRINVRKTRLQSAAVGRRVVTGYAVDDQVHPTREVKRRLRAAKHSGRPSHAAGLEEFCRLKLPKNYTVPVAPQAAQGAAPLSNSPQRAKTRENPVSSAAAPAPGARQDGGSDRKRAFDFGTT